MRNLALASVLLLSFNLFSQELTEKVTLKLYTNFDCSPKYIYHDTNTANGTTLREYEKEINGFNFSPAIVLNSKKGNSSEIEISRFRYSNKYAKEYSVIDSTGAVENTLSGSYNKQFELFLRYEYKLHLFKKKDWETIKPILGFSASPFFQWKKSEPLLSNEYTSSNTSVGLYLSIVPRVEYVINERWYLDLNIPIALVTTHYARIRHNSPNLPIDERVETIFDFYNCPVSFAIRFGIGVKI